MGLPGDPVEVGRNAAAPQGPGPLRPPGAPQPPGQHGQRVCVDEATAAGPDGTEGTGGQLGTETRRGDASNPSRLMMLMMLMMLTEQQQKPGKDAIHSQLPSRYSDIREISGNREAN